MQWFASSKQLCQITFVPIGNFTSTSLQALASYYEQTLGLHIDVRPAIPFEESMMDRSRSQLIGEELVNGMKTGYPTQAQDRSVMMVGFTRGDMYIRHKNWQFAFAHREDGRFAAISTARMDPVSFGLPPNDGVLVRRLLKMSSKQIILPSLASTNWTKSQWILIPLIEAASNKPPNDAVPHGLNTFFPHGEVGSTTNEHVSRET
ncbi:MAG: hypothetical protein E6K65_06350 [Nitrospirae bacterium]|nr:MAG: hypothetical protein E6K65_06350 [Nitrospirota bacterium]